ncbi:cupin domain-containing protein [Haliangium sp.]|uniref:cupin domain-containing protein n=1 Tax=Haliangium sp. TaxID=2663208 RepID=UPI003D09CEF8
MAAGPLRLAIRARRGAVTAPGVLAVSALVVAMAAAVLAGCAPAGREPAPAAQAPGPAAPAAATSAPSAAPAPDQVDALRVAAIEDAVNATEAQRHECWARGAADDFRLAGRIVLRIGFDDSARAAVTVAYDQPADPVLTGCLVALYQGYAWPPVFGPGSAVELPFEFQAPSRQYTVALEHVQPVPLGPVAQAQILLDEQNTGNADISLTLITLRGELDMPPHGHRRATEFIHVLEGAVSFYPLDAPDRAVEVKAGQTVYLPPGVPHGVRHRGDGSLRIVQFFTPQGPHLHMRGREPVDLLVGEAARVLPRPGELAPVSTAPELYELAGGRARVAMHFDSDKVDDGAAYMGVLTAEPGMEIPLHRHPDETEVVFLLEGSVEMTIDGDRYQVEPMTAIQIPSGLEHGVKVTGDRPIRALQFYSPGGPEQRFKQMGRRLPTP